MARVGDVLERGDLLVALAGSLAEGGRLVFVGGEAGVGKTTLVGRSRRDSRITPSAPATAPRCSEHAPTAAREAAAAGAHREAAQQYARALRFAGIAIGRVRARRGDPGAMDVLGEALELARPGGHLQRLGHVHAARAETMWLAGDAERAGREAQAAYELALEKRHLWFAGELAYWQHHAGVLDTWPEWVAEPYRLELEGSAKAAAEAWRARGCPYEAARALAELAEERPLLEALVEFERLGAGPAAKAARRRLRAVGAPVPRGPRATTRANPAELTTRELDVLRLVVAGRRNAEIGAELVVSRRTVDHHVSAILGKLGVRSRGEAALAARDRRLLDGS